MASSSCCPAHGRSINGWKDGLGFDPTLELLIGSQDNKPEMKIYSEGVHRQNHALGRIVLQQPMPAISPLTAAPQCNGQIVTSRHCRSLSHRVSAGRLKSSISLLFGLIYGGRS